MATFDFFEHSNFGGKKLELYTSCPDLRLIFSKSNWSSGISSFQFPMLPDFTEESLKVEFYEKPNYLGKSLIFSNNPLVTSEDNLRFIGNDFNDKVASIKIYRNGKLVERLTNGKKVDAAGVVFFTNGYNNFFRKPKPGEEKPFFDTRITFNSGFLGCSYFPLLPNSKLTNPSLLMGGFTLKEFHNASTELSGNLKIDVAKGKIDLEITQSGDSSFFYKTGLEILRFEKHDVLDSGTIYANYPNLNTLPPGLMAVTINMNFEWTRGK